MTRQLTDAGEHGRLQGHEGGIWQQLDLVQDGEDHVGPCLSVQEKILVSIVYYVYSMDIQEVNNNNSTPNKNVYK